MKYKRYCKTLSLKDNPELIEKYKKAHAIGQVWPEISNGMKEVGILDMEIYIHGNTLFMIMDTVPGFDHEKSMKMLASKPRQGEWEAYMSEFQKTNAIGTEKWELIERIFELDQEKDYKAIDGQKKEFGLN